MATLVSKTIMAGAAAVALASCSPKPEAPKPAADDVRVVTVAPAPPDIQADLAEAAKTPAGQPNLRVCLHESLQERLALPAGVIFVSWGRKDGAERNPKLDADALKPGAIRYAVVTARPMVLSADQPCAETIATAATSDLFEWRMPLARRSQDLQFQVAGVEDHMAWPLTNRLGEVVKKGLIFAYPTGDIGRPRRLKEEG